MIELLWTYLGAEVGAYCESFDRHLATGILDRTQPNRLDDHILLLRDLELEREHPIPIFLDIAPGLGNLEYPAATALDMARALSRTPVVAFDRPEAVEKFRRNCDRSSHEAVLRQKNLYVLAGDALKPLPPQIEFDLQGRRIPAISRRYVILRTANGIDIYCPRQQNEALLRQTAADFGQNPVLFLFNSAILFKQAGRTKYEDWRLVGHVSGRGFNHRTRFIPPYGPEHEAPYALDRSAICG